VRGPQPFTLGEFVQVITPLFFVCLLIERALEVFLTSWRGAEAARLESAASTPADAGSGAVDARNDREAYKSRTQRIAFLAGTSIGVIIAALGVRALELLVDPAVFGALPELQRTLFRMADVLFTGAILGGGADGLHKLVSVFTNFMDATARQSRARGGTG
jgi:hypothetical protein